ncbi:IS3 family transposase [Labilibaculum euxinus]
MLLFFQAKIAIVEFIEIWYNRKRRHSYLDYISPLDFGIKYYKNVA